VASRYQTPSKVRCRRSKVPLRFKSGPTWLHKGYSIHQNAATPLPDCDSPTLGYSQCSSIPPRERIPRAKYVEGLKRRHLDSERRDLASESHQSYGTRTQSLNQIQRHISQPKIPCLRRINDNGHLPSDQRGSSEVETETNPKFIRRKNQQRPKTARLDEISGTQSDKATLRAVHSTPSIDAALSESDKHRNHLKITDTNTSKISCEVVKPDVNRMHIPLQLAAVPNKHISEPHLLHADYVLVQVLRKISAGLAGSAEAERLQIMIIAESVTREVLCSCKSLADGEPFGIIWYVVKLEIYQV
jgi:hypothetical protein